VDEAERAEWSARIAAANEDVITSRARIENIVIDARRAGASWAAIAAGLGCTRQAAQERFTKLDEIERMDQPQGAKP
jgi:hypothetical protein